MDFAKVVAERMLTSIREEQDQRISNALKAESQRRRDSMARVYEVMGSGERLVLVVESDNCLEIASMMGVPDHWPNFYYSRRPTPNPDYRYRVDPGVYPGDLF